MACVSAKFYFLEGREIFCFLIFLGWKKAHSFASFGLCGGLVRLANVCAFVGGYSASSFSFDSFSSTAMLVDIFIAFQPQLLFRLL